jgi:peptide/nickel transport system permease protein
VLQNPQGQIAIGGLLLLVVLATLGSAMAGDPIAQNASGRFLAPSLNHLFGTDELRRDLFARSVVGLQISLAVSISSVALGASIGISIGFLAGYAGGWTETVAMRVMDAFLAFPGLLTALAILTILGSGSVNVAIAIAALSIPTFARLSRAQMLSEKNRAYVEAAYGAGAGRLRIIFRHVAPNTLPPLLTHVALVMAAAVLIEASLAFLGLGQQPPAPSLGGLVNASKTHLAAAWWYAFFPSALLAILLLCLNLLADAVNEATSPYARSRATVPREPKTGRAAPSSTPARSAEMAGRSTRAPRQQGHPAEA